MSATTAPAFMFRRRSWLGLAVGLFLLYGAANVLIAAGTTIELHRNGAGGAGETLVLSQTADTALLGRSPSALAKADPKLGAFLVSFMDSMCAYMMAVGLLTLGLAWFALRRGHAWALWTLAVGNLAVAPFYVAIVRLYARFGVPPGNLFVLELFTAILVAATAFGWIGLRTHSARAGLSGSGRA